MATFNRGVLDVLAGSLDPNGNIVGALGALYQRQLTTTTAAMYCKVTQAVAGVPDNTGWTQVAAPVSTDPMTLTGTGLPANPLAVLGISAAGIVGGGVWAKPAVSHQYDDEFDQGPALNVAWSVTSGTLNTTDPIDPYVGFATGGCRMSLNGRRPNWLMLQADSSLTQVTITKAIPALTGTDFCVWMHGCFNNRVAVVAANNDFTFGLTMSSDPYDLNNDIIMFLNESDPSTIQLEFLKRVAGVVTSVAVTANVAQNDRAPWEGVLLQKIGTNYHAWAIMNNGSEGYMGTTAFATAIGRAGFFASNASSTTPGCMIVGVDFIRFVAGATFLP